MFEVYNRSALTQKQRFLWAIGAGILSSLVIGFIYGMILVAMTERFGMAMVFSIVYVGIGWAIGWVIQTVGRGVQVRFSILGACCAVLCFILADIVFQYSFMFSSLDLFIRYLPEVFIDLVNPASLLETAFKLFGVYYAYVNARFVR